MLDGVEEPATVEELEAVVHRAGQRMRARLVAGAVALLAVGGVVGALARGPVADDPPGFAARPGTATTLPHPAATMAFPYGPIPGWTLTPLFRREANGVAIRAYRSTLSPSAITVPEAPVDPACLAPTALIRGELSNGAAVGVAEGPDKPGTDLGVLASGEFGRAEGERAAWAIVRAPAGIATVRLTAGAVTDTMVPDDGIAVLAVATGASAGTVEGLAADGKVLATKALDQAPEPMFSPACSPPCPADHGPVAGAAVPPTPEQAPPPSAGPPGTMAPLPPNPARSTGTTIVTEDHAACASFGYGGQPTPVTTAAVAPSTSTAAAGAGPGVARSTIGQGPTAPTTAPAPSPSPPAPTSTAPPGTAP